MDKKLQSVHVGTATATKNKTSKSGSSSNSKQAANTQSGQTTRVFPIVAIGASAGGLEALEQFLGNVPADSGIAFIVIQHLDPNHKGIMPELLQRATAMPVAQVKNRTKVIPDHVYVIPPNKDLSILHGILYLLDPVAPRGLRLPIDFFFRTLADDMQNYAVGVVLSGMGSDGTLGVRAIKEKGGLVLAQEPASSRFDSMPRSAIGTALVDIVAPAEQLPLRIVDCLSHVRPAPGTISGETETEAQKSGFDKICILLRTRTGHDFSHYKKSTVYRRIERRMAIHQLGRVADYVRYLRENAQEIDLLFKELLIGVTSFFRDPAAWAYVQEKALPELLANMPDGGALRAWVAGCSTGEEAYSLAMVFREVVERAKPQGKYSLQIFATDLDSDAVEKARVGAYPANIAADVSEERLKRFFIEEDNGGYRIGKDIREMVVFAPQNVVMDPPFTKLDILTCRNLLIYLDAELQKKLLPLFHYSLKPGGILMLGSAETIGSFTDLFTPLEGKARLFRRSSSPLRALEVEFPTRYVPSKTVSAMNSRPEATPPNLQSLTEQLLLQQFSPAAVLVNGTGDIVYISGRTGKYLEPATGKANWNIHAMARDGLRQGIAVALPKAFRNNKTLVCRNLSVDGDAQKVDMTVYPVQEPSALRGMALVVFADVATPASLQQSVAEKKLTRHNPHVAELELAFARAQQELKTLNEEMQTSQEELKSTNEELQSTNEELQSTNEELTTSKEEMQSLNEELQTVNIELQSKVDELSAANNDMKNLLNSTDIATVFLDNALHVRRFTSQVTRLFKLIPGDVGRPLSDIVNELVYPDLLDDVTEVLRTLVYSDREIATTDGRWFQVKIMPYRTLNNVIDGVVITFSDITSAKQLEAKLRMLADKS